MSLIEYWREFLAVISLLSGVIIGRKSRDFKEKTEGAGAIAALQSVYEGFIQHNRELNKELLDRIVSLEKHNRELQKHFNDILFSYSTLQEENKKLSEKYKEVYKEYTELKVAHDKLKREFENYKEKSKLEDK